MLWGTLSRLTSPSITALTRRPISAGQTRAMPICSSSWERSASTATACRRTTRRRSAGTGRPQGDAGAEFCLGWMYENGLGVTRDCAEALKWYRLAADQDYAEAENSLGELYRGGLGTPQDYGEAVRWFYRAARQGNADAENSLGTMYAGGFGVLRDYSEALKWYLRAAAKHHPTARYNLGCLCEHGLGSWRDVGTAVTSGLPLRARARHSEG